MKDYEKTSYLDHNQTRRALLENQLLKCRDAINKSKAKLPGAEDLEMLLTRESTLLSKIASIPPSQVKVSNNIDKEYQNLISVIPFIGCDVCEQEIEYGAVRYHCTEKNNYDICQKCYTSSPTSHPYAVYVEKYDNTAHQKRIAITSSTAEMLYVAFQCFMDRPCLGEKNGAQFEWLPYREVYKKSMSIGAGLRHKFGIKEREAVAIHSRNNKEWIYTDLACLMNGFVSVPVHHVERDPNALSYIVNNCNVTSVFCEAESADLFRQLQATTCPNLKSIVIYSSSSLSPSTSSPSLIKDWTGLTKYSDLEAFGSLQKFTFYPLNPSDIVSIIHTSGSTGKPKGAPFTDRAVRENLTATISTYDPNVSICFEPLAHISEREFLHEVLTSGGRTAIINISNSMLDDIANVGPCSISSTPRFWNVIHSKYQQTLVLEQSLSSSKAQEAVKKEVLSRFKTILGTRLKHVGCGGAAPSQQLLQFLTECFGASTVSDGYGSTEAGSIAGKEGFLASGVKIKILDVPELGYFTTDAPYARGELYVQTKSMISGYHNNPEDTARLFVDGWFCTGDIVELLGERQIKIIDRKKNFFKLSQGEYVAAEKLENRYLSSSFVDQIFITCGDITKYEQNSVFAIVVPHLHLLQKWAQEHGIIHQSDKDLCANPRALEMIMQNFKIIAHSVSLASYEIPGNIILEPEMFTVENGKMTSSNKLARPILERFYKDRVNEILEEKQKAKEGNMLWKILSEILGNFDENSKDTKKSLADIGGDSLSAVRLSSALDAKLNIEIPPHVLLDKNITLETLSQIISNAGQANSLSFSNSQLENQIANDLKLSESILVPVEAATPSEPEFKVILVTGATGFVGSHLVKQLLIERPQSQVVCLVRSTSQAPNVQDRLHTILQQFRIWNDIESEISRLSVIEGDFGRNNLGLSEQKYTELLQSVEVVFHNGAVVNHVLPYSSMRDENVIGTKNIIEFTSQTAKRARLNFISTVSSIPRVPESAAPIREILEYVVKSMGGYEQSKYVAEKLVQQAFDKKLVYGSILRLGMVGWNSVSGSGNPNDWLFILFGGIMALGKAPDSSAEFEMLPVNIVCEVLSNHGFSTSSIGSTLDICGNNLISFKSISKYLDVDTVPFQEWKTYLLDQIQKPNNNNNNKKALEGLLLFSKGLPDDREYKKEIMERSKYVTDQFSLTLLSYEEEVIKSYLEIISFSLSTSVKIQ